MLKGQAKTDYMREYMRNRRLRGRLLDPSVRPTKEIVRLEYCMKVLAPPEIDADGNVIPE